MRPKCVVMKVDKLLSFIVPMCEKRVYFKLTNNRPSPMSPSNPWGCIGKQINGQFNCVFYANINLKSK